MVLFGADFVSGLKEWYYNDTNAEERTGLKEKIRAEIGAPKRLIEILVKTSQPSARDNAIGRLTRMEAISSRGVSEASLNPARANLENLETALENVEEPDFRTCIRCLKPMPLGRILAMPENVLCVLCAEMK